MDPRKQYEGHLKDYPLTNYLDMSAAIHPEGNANRTGGT
jgi:hypothetical protein